jgi:hypothetical protein
LDRAFRLVEALREAVHSGGDAPQSSGAGGDEPVRAVRSRHERDLVGESAWRLDVAPVCDVRGDAGGDEARERERGEEIDRHGATIERRGARRLRWIKTPPSLT